MDQNTPVDAQLPEGGPVTTMDHEPVEPVAAAAAASVVPGFLAELTRAMQAAAEQQREHIAAVVADDAAGQVDTARKRAAVEAEELRRLAEEDVGDIQSWAADETERIRQEAGRRTDKRRQDLEAHLAKHDSIITSEIDGVAIAVQDYRSTLDQFFDELQDATAPAEIARRAGSLPPPPDLDAVRGAARAAAVAELANAPQETADEAVGDEPVAVIDAPGFATADDASEPTSDAAADDESADGEAAEAGPGLGVMDPDANGRSEDLPAPVPEGAVAGSLQPSSAAARLLRSLSSWNGSEHGDGGHGTQGT